MAVKVAVKKPRIAEIRITDCTSTLGLMLVWRGREGGRGRLQRQAQVSGAAGQGRAWAWAPARGPSQRKRRQPWTTQRTTQSTTRTDSRAPSIRLRVIFSHQPSSLPSLLFPSFLYLFLKFRPLPLFLSFSRHYHPLHHAQRALLHNSSLPSRHSTPHRTFIIAQNSQSGAQNSIFVIAPTQQALQRPKSLSNFPLRESVRSQIQEKI